PPRSPLFPYTPLCRSEELVRADLTAEEPAARRVHQVALQLPVELRVDPVEPVGAGSVQRLDHTGQTERQVHPLGGAGDDGQAGEDRKSTRLNSSHVKI